MTTSLKRWIKNGAPDKGDLEEDSCRILRQYYMQKEGRLYLNKDGIVEQVMHNKGKKFEWNDRAQEAFENIKRELCEAPVLGMRTEKGMYLLNADASLVVISGILHQEQKWNGRTVPRPIAYGRKFLIDTEMKYGAPKAEMIAVVTFLEKCRAYLASAPSGLLVDNRFLSELRSFRLTKSAEK